MLYNVIYISNLFFPDSLRNVNKHCRSFIFIVKPILYEQNLRMLTCHNSFDSDQYLILCCIQISLAAFTTHLQKLLENSF